MCLVLWNSCVYRVRVTQGLAEVTLMSLRTPVRPALARNIALIYDSFETVVQVGAARALVMWRSDLEWCHHLARSAESRSHQSCHFIPWTAPLR